MKPKTIVKTSVARVVPNMEMTDTIEFKMGRSKMIKGIIVLSLLILELNFSSSIVQARVLTNVEIYKRCYGQLTQSFLPPNDAVLAQIKAGSKQPATACTELLDKAKFRTSDGNRLNTPTDPISILVLNSMYQVHQTFFLSNALTETTFENSVAGMKGMYDPGEPALYYTKALFDSATSFDYVVTANVNLRADRTGNAPTVSTEGENRSNSTFAGSANFTWASIGQLLGVTVTGDMPITSTFGNANIGATRGGGILGSPTYLMTTVNEFPEFKATASAMPRKWAKSVLSDFLCRELPVARLSDTNSFVDSSANAIGFRQEASCTQCHASMDRLSGVNRNFKYLVIRPNVNINISGGYFPVTHPTTASLDGTAWPSVVTTNYYQRPTLGVLYYRDYKGGLVNQNLTSIPDLGTKLTQQEDFYVCAAKRYYKYFMGVDVDIMDPEDPRYRNKGSDMAVHKAKVVELGLALKTNKSLRTLIDNIFKSDLYKQSNLGIQGQ